MKIYTPQIIGTSSIAGPLTVTSTTLISGSLKLGASQYFNQINIENAYGYNNLSADGNSNEIIMIGTGNTANKGQDLCIGQDNNTGYHGNGQANKIIGQSNTMSNGGNKSRNFIIGNSNTLNHDGNDRVIMGNGHQSAQSSSYSGIFAGFDNTVSHDRSVVIGGQLISTAAADTVYVPNFVVTGSSTITGTSTFNGTSTFTQATIFSGSIRGEVRPLSISSNTASLDCSSDNFYTLQLVSGSNTFINPSNILPGQTINLRVNTTGSATVSFPSSVLQQSGLSYIPTSTTGVDVLTFISFDSTSLLLSNIKNFV